MVKINFTISLYFLKVYGWGKFKCGSCCMSIGKHWSNKIYY